ncbi:MAG: cytochrome C oxidase subunit IV family protein [Candidatus Acidiferrales bacterium]
MSHDAGTEMHQAGTTGQFLVVWFALVAITAGEVFLAYLEYMRTHPAIMLTLLVGLSIIKAALIMSYFMHLRFERLSLVLWLVPAMVFCLCMIIIFFMPDANRMLQMRLMH